VDCAGEPLVEALLVRNSAAGLDQPHHDGSELYVRRLGDSAELGLRAAEGDADAVMLRYVRDGEARVIEASPAAGGSGEVWWRAELPLRSSVVAYRWLLAGGRGGYRCLNGDGVHPHEVPPFGDFRLVRDPSGPDWHLDSVVYEVFVDRFGKGGERRTPPPWGIAQEWDAIPDTHTRNPNREYYGGDLAGVEQHLDHIDSLGANVVYLTPFFPADTNHRYDPVSFERVDDKLGGEHAFESLVRAAHERGLRLVGDLSLDHCGSRHEWLLRAQAEPSSPDRSCFLFARSETHGYASWLGWKEMARFDWRSDELRSRMAAIVRRWVDAGLDGWRLGAAGSVGRYRDTDLNTEVAQLVRSAAGDALLVGEYWYDFQPDLDGRGWHGVMDYAGFLRPVWWWLRDRETEHTMFDIFAPAPAPTYGGSELATLMRSFHAGVPWEAVLHSWNVLESHDTPRFRNVAGSRGRHLVGLGLQMTTPGVPMIFAGSELGLEGRSGYDARRTMPWAHPDQWDGEVLREYRTLVALRRSHGALARGGMRYAHAGEDAVAYLRETKTERLLCLAARAPHEPITVPFHNLVTLYGEDATDGTLPSDGPAFHVWQIDE
jgi:alpha-glucosidase